MLTASFNALRSILTAEIPPTRVIDVRPEQYTSKYIHCREDALILYTPKPNSREKEKYEIVLHRPYTDNLNQAFSLFRTDNLESAEDRFICLKDKLPMLIEISKDMCSINGVQKICDTLNEHPSWSIAHLAAHFGLNEVLKNPKLNALINSCDPIEGISPIQVAVKSNSIKIVRLLIDLKCDLEHLDNKGNTVYHYAANTNKDILFALSQNSPRCLNYINNEGYTPLHMACLYDKPDCVNALLMIGADVNISAVQTRSCLESTPGYVDDFLQANPNKLFVQDMKFGGTPLHWSGSRQVIEALANSGCNIDALNFDNRTALHIMALRKRLDCAVALLSRGIKIDVADNKGNTPLHIAVKEANPSLVQALVIFGADVNYKNGAGLTPRHLAANARSDLMDKILFILDSVSALRCTVDSTGCTDGCKSGGKFNGIPPPIPPGPQNRDLLNEILHAAAMENAKSESRIKGGRLLCLDGGGIRGLVLIQMLLEIENITQRPIVHCFDWVSGTSTGGILALGIALGKSMKDCQCLYFRMKEHAFTGNRPYPSNNLENILQEAFGSTTLMSDIKCPKIMITGVLADRKPVDLHLFRNYESPYQLLKIPNSDERFQMPPVPEEQLVWQAARATGAAPSYFRAYGRYLDGGLIANNPTLDALTEIYEYNLALKSAGRTREIKDVTLVVSLGTGLIPVTPLAGIDIFRPEKIVDTAKLAFGLSTIGTLLVDQATASDGRVVDRGRAWCSMIGVPFFRFSPQMSENIAMDEKSDETLVNMLWEAKAYIHANIVTIQQLAVLLCKE